MAKYSLLKSKVLPFPSPHCDRFLVDNYQCLFVDQDHGTGEKYLVGVGHSLDSSWIGQFWDHRHAHFVDKVDLPHRG